MGLQELHFSKWWKMASVTKMANMSNICCVFGEYSDEMAKKPVSDGEKGESGMQKKSPKGWRKFKWGFSGKMVNLAK